MANVEEIMKWSKARMRKEVAKSRRKHPEEFEEEQRYFQESQRVMTKKEQRICEIIEKTGEIIFYIVLGGGILWLLSEFS